MAKKVKAPHMSQIMQNIEKFPEFTLVVFEEDLIFNEEVEKWPIVESLIVFYSTGFPYSKVLKYINLRKPFLINDFESQKIFWDRRKVMRILTENNIPIPKEIIVERDNEIESENNNIDLNTSAEIEAMIEEYNEKYNSDGKEEMITSPKLNNRKLTNEDMNNILKEPSLVNEIEKITIKKNDGSEEQHTLKEYEEYIQYDNIKLKKPFVEKPCNGDDHNIYIYYPMSHGGGQTRLFRKTKDLSSLYYQDVNNIRRNGSYIYEEFVQNDGFDIKVYTVGDDYAHAEARKSPALDGIVERTNKGKEVRYPINLTFEEKEIARKIVHIFKQNVCGFDILRSKDRSYVCDVNGWSFVKGNKKYFEDCAIQIRKIVLSNLDPDLLMKFPINLDKGPVLNKVIINNEEELRSVVAVFRHADRSPKQKLKLIVEHPMLLNLFEIFKDENQPIDKVPKELKLKKPNELLRVLEIVKTILNEKGIKEDELINDYDNFDMKLFQIKLILERNPFEGMTRKMQIKPLNWIKKNNNENYTVTKALLIMKWGGYITHSGIEQARFLGSIFRRQFYPTSNKYGEGLLRLHSTYRHDLKCYSSEEGRCLKSAAAFLQGLLQFEGNLIPIITSMVRNDEQINKLLDVYCTDVEPLRKKVKNNLNDFCNYDGCLKDKYLLEMNNDIPETQTPVIELIDKIGNFHSQMKKISDLLDLMVKHLSTLLNPTEFQNECHTYFIKTRVSINARSAFHYSKSGNVSSEKIVENNRKNSDVINEHCESIDKNNLHVTNKNINEDNNNNNINKILKTSKTLIEKNINDKLKNINNKKEKKEQKKEKSKTKSKDKKKTSNQLWDCEEEKVVLIYKRYMKLYQDFYNKKKEKFDISKIPDIYDNVKYDIIHNKLIINEVAYQLFALIKNLAYFVMPLEYGIKIQEKIDIGIQFIKPLIKKIRNDLLWWSDSQPSENHDYLSLHKQERSSIEFDNKNDGIDLKEHSYSGLNRNMLDKGEIKSSWRHIKTRFYFTSQSHLYTLLNTLLYGLNSFLVDNNSDGKKINDLWYVFDLDYCSSIVFRVFENFKKDPESDERFRVELVVSPGANKNPKTSDENHQLGIEPWIALNKHLSIKSLNNYFNFIIK